MVMQYWKQEEMGFYNLGVEPNQALQALKSSNSYTLVQTPSIYTGSKACISMKLGGKEANFQY